MKNKGWLILSLMALTVIFTGCGTQRTGAVGSEVVVRRVDSNAMMRIRIFIDGRQVGTLRIGETAMYKVRNGEHTVFVNSDSYSDKEPNVLEFTSYQSRHVFAVTDGVIAPLEGQALARNGYGDVTPVSFDLDRAVKTAFDVISKDLKNKTKVAVINIASDSKTEGNFIIEELTYLTVHSKKRFVVIDRRKIEAIRIEKNFDRTTNYEDDFLISIGHLLGANVVFTGNVNGTGELRRLRVKALDVKTGQLIGMASERV